MRKLFKGGNYSRAETIQGQKLLNTVPFSMHTALHLHKRFIYSPFTQAVLSGSQFGFLKAFRLEERIFCKKNL